ncbi:MAG: hypothetical protein ACTSYI_08990 [Promethearchaeota archaeon]
MHGVPLDIYNYPTLWTEYSDQAVQISIGAAGTITTGIIGLMFARRKKKKNYRNNVIRSVNYLGTNVVDDKPTDYEPTDNDSGGGVSGYCFELLLSILAVGSFL